MTQTWRLFLGVAVAAMATISAGVSLAAGGGGSAGGGDAQLGILASKRASTVKIGSSRGLKPQASKLDRINSRSR